MRHKGADFAETDENKHIFRVFGKNENKKMRTFIFAFNYKLYSLKSFLKKKYKTLEYVIKMCYNYNVIEYMPVTQRKIYDSKG